MLELHDHDENGRNDSDYSTEPASDNDELNDVANTGSGAHRAGRGFGKPNFGSYKPEPISFDEDNNPVGVNANRFTRVIAILAREPNALPLHVKSWKIMKKEHNSRIHVVWERVLSRIALTSEQQAKLPQIREMVVRRIHKSFSNFKRELKLYYLKKGGQHNNRRYDAPMASIDETSWRQLVEHWESPTHKKVSENNKRAASKQSMHRATGSRSHAQLRYMFEEENNRKPEPFEFYKLVFQSKKGSWPSLEAKRTYTNIEAKISELPPELREDPNARNGVFREEVRGHAIPRRSRTSDISEMNIVCRQQVERELREEFEAREQELRAIITKHEEDKKAYEASMNEKVNLMVNEALQARNVDFANSFQRRYGYGPMEDPLLNTGSFVDTLTEYGNYGSQAYPYNAANRRSYPPPIYLARPPLVPSHFSEANAYQPDLSQVEQHRSH